jgi:hypothetical protein
MILLLSNVPDTRDATIPGLGNTLNLTPGQLQLGRLHGRTDCRWVSRLPVIPTDSVLTEFPAPA